MFGHARSLVVIFRAVMLVIGVIPPPALAAPTDGPAGSWQTANGNSVVAIEPCGDALCGRIVGIDRAPTEPMPTDVHGRPQCGLTIIHNERRLADGIWRGAVT